MRSSEFDLARRLLELLGLIESKESIRRRTERSLTKTIFEKITGTQVELKPGCIVSCDLFGVFEHTGIYVGRGKIVERNGNGNIKKVSVQNFLSSSSHRTGAHLYVACQGGKPIRCSNMKYRAELHIKRNESYDLITNNCHKFTAYCISGEKLNITSFTKLTEIIKDRFGTFEWKSAKDC